MGNLEIETKALLYAKKTVLEIIDFEDSGQGNCNDIPLYDAIQAAYSAGYRDCLKENHDKQNK